MAAIPIPTLAAAVKQLSPLISEPPPPLSSAWSQGNVSSLEGSPSCCSVATARTAGSLRLVAYQKSPSLAVAPAERRPSCLPGCCKPASAPASADANYTNCLSFALGQCTHLSRLKTNNNNNNNSGNHYDDEESGIVR